jgi:hypothetical protein
VYRRFPPELGDLTELVHLDIASKYHLEGELPSSLVKLKNLTFFSLKNTKVKGKLPTEIGDIISLTYFAISDSLVDGEIPQSLCLLLE